MGRNVITILDGAAGSCGKAKVVGELATDKSLNIGAAVTNCMPNAGHTYVDEQGRRTVFRNIPVSSINPHTDLFIGAGSAIDMEVFKREYAAVEPYLQDRKIYVHELVPLIEERHKEYERKHVKSGSTLKGCGAVSSDKIMRDPDLNFFKTYKNAICCSNDEWLDHLYKHLDNSHEYVLLEGAQGCGLSLNYSSNYPYVTSRNVSASRLLDDSGIGPTRHLENIMVIRPFTIRISNVTESGAIVYTGNCGKSRELTWTEVNLCAKTGLLPYEGFIDSFDYYLPEDIIVELLDVSSEMTKKQIFGTNYNSIDIHEVTILQALEMERIFYKDNNTHRYISNIIQFPDGINPYIEDISENTTVTQKERRIFELDLDRLKSYLRINESYGLYLNFFQQLDNQYHHQKSQFDPDEFPKFMRNYFDWIESNTNTEIIQLGTGARNNERMIKKSLIMR